MNLNHIDLPVSDIDGARAFFETYFGFRCVFAREDGLTVLLDETNFALTLSAPPLGESSLTQPAFTWVSICGTNTNC
jgi:lactoylglutathione lyase